jgi:hypothetical protein
MKKPLHYFLTIVLLASFITGANAQVFFTEDFEGAPGANGLPAGWTETGLSTDGIWNTGNAAAASSPYIIVPAAIQGTNFAFTNDDACNCDKSADRIILPAQDLSNIVGARVIFDAYLPGSYGGTGTVEVSTDNGVTWTIVNTLASSTVWQDDLMVNISAYTGAGNTNVLVSFLYNDGNAWADAMAIDDVKLDELTSLSPDMALTSASGSEYTIVPFSQITTVNFSADVTNTGSANATDASLTVNVYNATNLTTPIQTTSSTATAVNVSASANLTAGSFTPTAVADYVFEYITTATGDANALNDTMFTYLTIDGSMYARDDSNITSSFGIGAGPTGYLGYMFSIVATAPVDSVFAAINKPGTSNTPGDGVGDVTRFLIFDVVSGLPSTIIGESINYTFTATDTLGLITKTLAIQATGGGTLTLTPGTYFVAAEENNTNLGLAFTDNNFQTNTFYYSWTGQPWAAAETFPANFQKASVIRPILGCELTATTSTTDASCGNADGSATVTPTNGISPYNYLWSDGQTAATATNLTSGSYSVTITDDNGCTGTVSGILVNNPNSPSVSATVTSNYNGADISCNGGTDGEALAAASGGTAPYTYLWSDGQTTTSATNLAAGTYNVTVTDDASCNSVSSVTITEPTAITSTDVVTDVSCNGDSDGAIELSVTGGTGTYTFLWSNTATTEDLTGLTAGVYTATVTDVNGCNLSVGPVTVSEPSALVLTETTTDATTVGGSDGAIDLTVSGGTSTYTYLWSNGATTEDISGLTAGTYTCTITDANGCSEAVSATVLDGVASLVNSNSGINSIKLFPNPANAQVNLSVDLTETSDINVEVVDASGKVLGNINGVDVLKTNYVLDISSWSNGIYFVKVQTTEGTGVIRFVKQ